MRRVRYTVRIYSSLDTSACVNAHICYSADEVLMHVGKASNEGYFCRVYGGMVECGELPILSLADVLEMSARAQRGKAT
jgi:hypothetical protein